MPNMILPGDIIFSQSVAPGLGYALPNDKSSGYPFFAQSITLNALGSLTEMKISPDNTKLARVTGTNFGVTDMSGDFNSETPSSAIVGTGYSVAWHPAGNRIAVAHATSPFLTQYSYPALDKLVEVDVLPVTTGSAVAYSPNGAFLVCGFRNSTYTAPGFSLYDAVNNIRLSDPPNGLLSNAVGFDFSPDSSLFCAVGFNTNTSHCRVYNTSDWSSFGLTKLAGSSYDQGCKFSPDGSKLAIFGNSSPRLRVYDTATWVNIGVPATLDAAAITDVAWFDNNILVTASSYIRVLDYTTSTPVELHVLNGGHSSAVIEVRRDGVRRKFAGVVTDGGSNFLQRKVRAIDRNTGRPIGETVSSAVDGTFELIVFSPNPAIVYCVGKGAEITKFSDSVTPVPL